MGIAIKIGDKDFSDKKVKKISFVSVQSVESISAVFAPGDNKIYESSTLNSLKDYLTVTASYSDGSTGAVTNYELSGTLTEGTSVITVTYEGKTTAFNVLVSHLAVLSSIDAVYTQGETVVYSDTPLNDLKAGLVVTATYDDQTTSTVIPEDYNLSGTLSVGTSTITVSYGGETDTFDVVVSSGGKELESISAVYTQSGAIYPSTTLNDLKNDLVVTALYDDTSTEILLPADYTLSGTLAEGTSTVTVTYNNKTTTFSVTVSAEPLIPAEYQQVKYLYKTGVDADYISTGVNIVPSTDTVEVEFETTSYSFGSNKFACPFGDWWTNANSGIYCFINNAGKAWVRCGESVKITDNLELNVKHTLSVYHDTIILDGTSIGEPDGTYGTVSNKTMKIFASSYNGAGDSPYQETYFLGKIYSFKISRNGQLIHNYVPCYRKSDNKTGMYDTITSEFKPSNSTYILAGETIEPVELESISATYTQGEQVVYADTALDNLKSNLVVVATYDDSSREVVFPGNYTLSGTLTEGTSTVTVTYQGKTTTFNVTVSPTATLSSITATYTQGQTIVYPSTPLSSLKDNLVVVATYSDSSIETLSDSEYTLSGTLAEGTSTITATFGGETDTFSVTVSEEPTLTSISATYTQGQTVVYPSTSLDSLKSNLVVTGTYSDSSTVAIPSSDYTLSGTLTEGTSTVTVTYSGETDTFTVTVSAEPTIPAEYQQVEYIANSTTGSSCGYVDTGIQVAPSTDKVEVEFTPTSFSSYAGNAFGCPAGDYWTNYSHGIYSYITSSGGMTVRCGKNVKVASATDAPLTALVANTKYTLSVYHDTVLINGLSCGTPDGTYATASPWNMHLLASHHDTRSEIDTNTAFIGQVHSLKIYRNDVLTHEFIPCYRKSDNVIGVYDVIDQAFAAGTGAITKGSDV